MHSRSDAPSSNPTHSTDPELLFSLKIEDTLTL